MNGTVLRMIGLLGVLALAAGACGGPAVEEAARENPGTESTKNLPQPVSEPEPLPNEPGTWTVETSLGTWTWTRIDADDGSLVFPDLLPDGRYYGRDDAGDWRVSEDGLVWTKESPDPTWPLGPEPGPRRGPAYHVGEDFWLVWDPPDEGAVYRREVDRWVRVGLPELPLPQIAGMIWESSSWEDPFVRSGEVTLAPVTTNGSPDWESHGIGRTVWDEASRTLTVWSTSDEEAWDAWDNAWDINEPEPEPTAVLSVSIVPGDPDAAEFREQETGELILRLEATDPAVTVEQLAGDDVDPSHGYGVDYWAVSRGLLLDRGEGFQAVEPPWRGLPVRLFEVATVDSGGFVAVGAGRDDRSAEERTSLVYSWASPDGVAWEELESPLPVAGRVESIRLAGDGGRLVMMVHESVTGEKDRTSLWASTDGSDWQPAQTDLEGDYALPGLGPSRTGFGWAFSGFLHEFCDVWLSPDGLEWERVPSAPVMVEPEGDGGTGCSVVGDAAFATVWAEGGTRSLWVGHLDE